MNFLSAFQFLSPKTYSFQLQYLFIVGSLPQSIKRAIPNETEYNQISKKIKPIKPKVIFLLSSLDRLHPFSSLHARLRALSNAKASLPCVWPFKEFLSHRVYTSAAGSFPFRIVFVSVNIPWRHVSYEHEQSKQTRDGWTLWEHFVPIYLLKFQQIFSWKEKASGAERVRESQQFSFSLEKWSDSLQLHIQDLIKLPLSGQHAWPSLWTLIWLMCLHS